MKQKTLFLWIYFDLILAVFIGFKIITMHTSILKPVQYETCLWNSSTNVGSTDRDVVFLYATSIAKGLALCIKSLRSTGSRCRIILFMPIDTQIYQSQQSEFDSYNVTIVRVKTHIRRGKEVPHMDRYEHERDWLKKNIESVDRVFHTDAFDVFFQGDPFASSLTNDTLLLALEPHQFRSCGWNLAWMRECYGGEGVGKLNHNFILCSGSIGGSALHYLKLLDLMISQKEWESCWDSSKDQPILNYIIWTGIAAENGIKYKFTGCNDGFFTMQWCIKGKHINFNEHGQIVSLENTVPVYIHQYNRYPELTNHLYSSCGI